ncbi:SH3 domain-containing protein [Allokutzneria albata]|nr:SH3 domain-containing protein [Allokutzneria albata]
MLVTAALPVVATAAVLTATPSAVAAPAACPNPAASDKDSGWGTTKDSTGGPIRVGPSTACATRFWPMIDDKLFYNCYVVNSSGQKWTHVRPDVPNSADKQGWVFSGHLDDGGATKRC